MFFDLAVLQQFLIELGHFLLIVDLGQVVFLQLVEDLPELLRVRKEEFISVVIIRHVNKAELHQLFEPLLPFFVGDGGVDRSPLSIRPLLSFLVLASWHLLGQEGEIHLDIVMDFLIVLKHDIIVEVGISLMPHNPVSFQGLVLLVYLSFPIQSMLFARELQQELLILLHAVERFLFLLDVALDLRDLLIKLFDVLFFSSLLILQLLFLLFLLFAERLVFANIVLQVHLVIFKLLGTINERLLASLLLFFQFSDLLIHRVVGELSQEHLFLLIDELVDILGSLLLRELHTAPGDMHGLMDVILLPQVEILLFRVMFTR